MFNRQGDVGIIKQDFDPKNMKKLETKGVVTLAYGEVTGHHHSIYSENVDMYVDDNGNLFIEAKEEVELKHQEHDTVKIDPGKYKIIPQREYHPKEIKRVID